MLCNIFAGNADEVQDAPWRQKGHPQIPAAVQRRSGAGAEEIAQLQTKLEELTLAAEQRAKDAWEQGVRAGDAAARKALEEQLRAATESLAKTVSEVAATRPEIIRRAENDTVRLAIEIARRVLHRELSIDKSALESLMSAAIVKLQTQEVYRVRVHPEQEKLMRRCLEKSGKASVEVIGDAAQPKSAVLFEISRGTLDASVETQLREIENGLADEMSRRS